MRHMTFLATLVLLATSAFADSTKSSTAHGSVKPALPPTTLSDLHWMLGSWTLAGRQSVTTETWTKESDKLIRGFSVTMKGSDTAFYEKITLVDDSLGIAYIAEPMQNSAPTRFSLSLRDTNKVIFENQAHDFPKVISYQFRTPDTLHARIEGPGKEGKTRGIDFVFTRVK